MSESIAQQNHITITPDIELIKLNDNFFIHTTWIESDEFGRFPSNGLIFTKNGKALLLDTPNSNEQMDTLYTYLKDSLNTKISKFIPGHSHPDCIGGFKFLQSVNVESLSGEKTKAICMNQNLPVPELSFRDSLTFYFEGEKVICRYFGGGHTIDNIVVYFPSSKILFGGCLVKSAYSKNLGYIKEAVLEEWDSTIEQILIEFLDIEIVIPGHGGYGDKQLLHHTIQLVRKFRDAK